MRVPLKGCNELARIENYHPYSCNPSVGLRASCQAVQIKSLGKQTPAKGSGCESEREKSLVAMSRFSVFCG
jgi:hypothetical protein